LDVCYKGVDINMKKATVLSAIAILLIIGTGGFAFAQAAPNLTGYFVAVDGQPTGPHDTVGLTELVNQGQLNRDTLVWRDGMPAWVAAGTVEELVPLLPVAPPPLPVAVVPPPIPGQAQQVAVSPAMPQPPTPQPATGERERRWHNSFSPAIEDSRVFFNAGIGLGPRGGYGMGIPPLSASVAFKVSETLPITIGATGIFTTWRWSTAWVNFTYMNIGVGARVMYHFNFSRNFDYYMGLNLGYVFQTVRGETFAGGVAPVSNSFFLWGAIVGARFFFTDRLGIYAEAGASSLQFLSVGLAIKF